MKPKRTARNTKIWAMKQALCAASVHRKTRTCMTGCTQEPSLTGAGLLILMSVYTGTPFPLSRLATMPGHPARALPRPVNSQWTKHLSKYCENIQFLLLFLSYLCINVIQGNKPPTGNFSLQKSSPLPFLTGKLHLLPIVPNPMQKGCLVDKGNAQLSFGCSFGGDEGPEVRVRVITKAVPYVVARDERTSFLIGQRALRTSPRRKRVCVFPSLC